MSSIFKTDVTLPPQKAAFSYAFIPSIDTATQGLHCHIGALYIKLISFCCCCFCTLHFQWIVPQRNSFSWQILLTTYMLFNHTISMRIVILIWNCRFKQILRIQVSNLWYEMYPSATPHIHWCIFSFLNSLFEHGKKNKLIVAVTSSCKWSQWECWCTKNEAVLQALTNRKFWESPTPAQAFGTLNVRDMFFCTWSQLESSSSISLKQRKQCSMETGILSYMY